MGFSNLPHRIARIDSIASFHLGPDAVQFSQDPERLRLRDQPAARKRRMFPLPGLQETDEVQDLQDAIL
jgi:hypothetical protein